MQVQDDKLVAALGVAIAQRIGEPRYKLWFDRHTRFRWDDDILTVGVPNRHFEEWLQKTFVSAVRTAAEEVFDQPMQVRFTIDPELFRAARQEQLVEVKPVATKEVQPEPAAPPLVNSERRRNAKSTASKESPTLFDNVRPRRTRRWKRLDDFVIGPCNRVAQAAALHVVEQPEDAAAPLVLHGAVSTGKTHLLEGIYVGLRRARADWRVCFLSAEDFTNRFVQAMRLGKLGSFRKYIRDCDAFLLDDFHFLASKKATQEEFLHTLDHLLGEGKVVVLTCDLHPRLEEKYAPELVDRLVGGTVWGLAAPNADTRLAILRSKAGKAEPVIADEVLHYLAGQLRGNARELEGALNSLRHYSRATHRPIDVALAREALADLLRHSVRIIHLEDIDTAVCSALRLASGSLQRKQRVWAVSHPRMLAMYLARKHTSAAYSEIGQRFGGRNHSTALAAEKKVRQWLQANTELSLGERTYRVREVLELVERELLR